jgi:hypothetical protein
MVQVVRFEKPRGRRALLGLAMAGSLLAGVAHGQTFMPSLIGNTVGNAIAGATEAACQKGLGLPPEPWPTTEAVTLDDLFMRFAQASAQGDAGTIKGLFSGGGKAGVAGVDGAVSPRGAVLPGWTGSGKLERTSLLFGADAHAARARWTSDGGGLSYTVDFVHGNWGGGWKILRVRAGPRESLTELPPHFCHIGDIAALW